MGTLRQEDRQLISERYTSGQSVAHIASGQQRSPNAISQSLSRIRGLLRNCIRRHLRRDQEGRP